MTQIKGYPLYGDNLFCFESLGKFLKANNGHITIQMIYVILSYRIISN